MQIITTNSQTVANTQTATNLQTAAAHAANAHAQNTNRAYQNDLKLVSTYFPNFLNSAYQIVTPLTATDVAGFLGYLIATGYTDKKG